MAKKQPDQNEARNSYHFREVAIGLRHISALKPDELATLKAEVDRIAGGATSAGDAGTSSSN